jgi:tripartite-type tricarboxylate transporter receptor subunit TctC
MYRSLKIATLAAALMAGPPSQAQQYPTRPVTLIVPYAPGGPADLVARLAADFIGKALGGAALVVEHRGGGGGIVGTAAAAKAEGDGYTLCVCAIGPISIAPATQELRYEPLKDLIPISLFSTNPMILLVHPSVKANSVQDLVALARTNPHPLAYSSPGVGALGHFSAEIFKAKTGIKLTHVPYRGSAPATMALVAGDVQFTFANMSDYVGQRGADTVRALGVTSAKRSPIAPDVPTMAEQGIPDFRTEVWIGLFAPKGTPRPIVDRLAAIAAEMAKDGTIRKRMAELGMVAVANRPEDFAKMLREETAQWARLVKQLNLQ